VPTPAGVGAEELRRANLRAILQTVHTHGPTTRAVLTKQLGLNRSTIGALTGELQTLGLVTEQTSAVGGRSGRPSHLVVPNADNVVVAVDVGVDRIAVAVVCLGGDVLARRSRSHQRGQHDVTHVVESVAQMVEDVLAVAPPQTTCLGIGVAVPGAVRAADGLVHFAPNLGWLDEPFSDLLSARLGRPVATGNDANLGVVAEHMRGVAVGYTEVAYLNASVGIGGGFLVGGVPLTGATGYAGEVGHKQVDSVGDPCRCGAVGCWETKVGENTLLQHAGRLTGGGPPAVAEVIAAAQAGEERAARVVGEVADWCGVGLQAIVNLFNPQIVVLAGCLAQVWQAAEERVIRSMERSALISPHGEVLVCAAGLASDSPLMGAAELAFAPVLENPQTVPQAV
jgi:predicted NBD/HSP70 family sugar kinase